MKVISRLFVVALILSLMLSVGTVVATDDLSFDQSDLEIVSYETYVNLGTSQENDDEIRSASKADGDSNSPLQKSCGELGGGRISIDK